MWQKQPGMHGNGGMWMRSWRQQVGTLITSIVASFWTKLAFLYWNFRQGVRDGPNRVAGVVDERPGDLWGDACEELDLTWRECLGMFNTNESHKTHYAPMVVLHIHRQHAPEIKSFVLII